MAAHANRFDLKRESILPESFTRKPYHKRGLLRCFEHISMEKAINRLLHAYRGSAAVELAFQLRISQRKSPQISANCTEEALSLIHI
ncbi:MAG TPA: hypothetical protein DD732_08925 [Rhizobiales bacterium]|nr:hypothetical protein [Hyphomicrobiales bacterium]